MRIRPYTGAPTTGTAEVQTLTIGGTPTGGTFKLNYGGITTAPITWVNVNATLLASIQTALQALSSLGSYVVVAAGALTAGVGTITITLNKAPRILITVPDNSLTGTSPTLAVARTTPGLTPNPWNSKAGQAVVDTNTGIYYSNTGTLDNPVWTKIGVQT